MPIVAITVNRHPTSVEDFDVLEKYCRKVGTEWFMSIEHAELDNQHCHIYLECKKRPDNVTRDIKKLLNIREDSPEWHVATDVKKATHPMEWLGYCGKELNKKLWRTNMPIAMIERCAERHLKMEVKEIQSINMTNFVDEVEKFAVDNDLKRQNVPVHIIYKLMYQSGNYSMNGFLIRMCHMKPHDLCNMRLYGKWETYAIKGFENQNLSASEDDKLESDLAAAFRKNSQVSGGV